MSLLSGKRHSRILSSFLICLLWPFLNGKAVRFSCPTAILCWTLILSDNLCDFPAPHIYCPISSLALQLEEKNLRLLMLDPLCGLGWPGLIRPEVSLISRCWQGCVFPKSTGNGSVADLYLLGISLSFSIKINVKDLFQPLSGLREVGLRGKRDGKILSRW